MRYRLYYVRLHGSHSNVRYPPPVKVPALWLSEGERHTAVPGAVEAQHQV